MYCLPHAFLLFLFSPVQGPVKKQKTLDNTRESDETVVAADDEEVIADEAIDEFSSYFQGDVEPKIIITSCYKPSKQMYEFIRDLLYVFPNSFYYKRQKFTIKQITEAAKKRGYTDLIIINEDKKEFNALTHVHLPEGPTAYYKLSNVTMCRDIEGATRHTQQRRVTQEEEEELIHCDVQTAPHACVLCVCACVRLPPSPRSRSHDLPPAGGDPEQLQHSPRSPRRSHARQSAPPGAELQGSPRGDVPQPARFHLLPPSSIRLRVEGEGATAGAGTEVHTQTQMAAARRVRHATRRDGVAAQGTWREERGGGGMGKRRRMRQSHVRIAIDSPLRSRICATPFHAECRRRWIRLVVASSSRRPRLQLCRQDCASRSYRLHTVRQPTIARNKHVTVCLVVLGLLLARSRPSRRRRRLILICSSVD